MPSTESVERRAAQFLGELCAAYTPAGSEARLLPPLERELGRLGAAIRIDEVEGGRVNVLAAWGEPKVLFSTHLDVVPPELPVRVDGEAVRGRGACDAKGQIAAQLGAIELLLAEGLGGFAWLGVSGEETDSAGARASRALAPLFRDCAAIIVGEPTGCRLAAGQKGFRHVRLACEGRAAHGGTPELGESAVLSLMDWIAALRRTEPALHERLGPEAWNLGQIEGGAAPNVVPDFASAEITLRSVPGGRLYRAIEDARPERGRIELRLDEPWDFFDLPPGFETTSVPFGSDLPAMRAVAPLAAAVLAGPGSPSLAHTEAEELRRSELAAGIGLFRSLGRHWLGGAR